MVEDEEPGLDMHKSLGHPIHYDPNISIILSKHGCITKQAASRVQGESAESHLGPLGLGLVRIVN